MLRSKIFIVLAFISVRALSQPVPYESVPQMDMKVSDYLENINSIYANEKNDAQESTNLRKANKQLLEYMKVLCQNPAVLGKDLPHSEGVGLLYATSDDHKLRFYAWDTWTGTSLHCFNVIAQFKTGPVSKWQVINEIPMATDELHDPGAYFTEINTLHTKNGKTVYLTVDCTVASARDKANRIQAYTIEKDSLKTIPFFKSDTVVEKQLDFIYNYASDTSAPVIFGIQFTGAKDKLYVPVVLPNGRLAQQKMGYDFDGYKFILSKKEKKRLAKELPY